MYSDRKLKGHPAETVAGWFIQWEAAEEKGLVRAARRLARGRRRGLNWIKVQLLVYFAHGWHLGTRGKPLVQECFEARPSIPTVGPLRETMLRHGNDKVPADDIQWMEGAVSFGRHAGRGTLAICERVWDVYGGWSETRMASKAREDGSPWERTRWMHGSKYNPSISDALLEVYYREQVDRNQRIREKRGQADATAGVPVGTVAAGDDNPRGDAVPGA